MNSWLNMTFRCRKLLDLAHEDTSCKADFPHVCIGFQGCEPAHADHQIFGRGVGFKTPDWAAAHLCHNAHSALSKMGREEKFYAWLRAYVATQDYLWTEGKLRIA
jgi:hypothetical protein